MVKDVHTLGIMKRENIFTLGITKQKGTHKGNRKKGKRRIHAVNYKGDRKDISTIGITKEEENLKLHNVFVHKF